jgi:biotin synthase
MKLSGIFDKAIEQNIGPNDAIEILKLPDDEFLELLYFSNKLRIHFKDNNISLCSIINAKSGRCSENCAFCAQSAHFNTNIDVYDFLPSNTIEQKAKKNSKLPNRAL